MFAGIAVLVTRDLVARGAANSQLLFELPSECGSGTLAGLHFPAGKLPLQRMRLQRCAPADQNAPVAFDDRRHHLKHVTIIGAQMYPERLLDHFQNPRNVGELPPPAVTVEVSNPACGDILRLSVRFENGIAAESRYKVRGCTASIAAGSALTEWIAGKSAAELAAFRPSIVDEAVGGLRAESKHAAVLCADGVK